MANKIGDILLLFSCLFLVILYNSLYFNSIFLSSNYNLINNIYTSLCDMSHYGYLLLYNDKIEYLLYNYFFLNINDFINLNLCFFTSILICFFIILASICKSAQAGFHF